MDELLRRLERLAAQMESAEQEACRQHWTCAGAGAHKEATFQAGRSDGLCLARRMLRALLVETLAPVPLPRPSEDSLTALRAAVARSQS